MIATASDRSSRRSRTRSRTSAGSTASCAAIFTGRSAAQSLVRAETPERPASMASQVDATSPPSGVVAPSPVTTTSGRVTDLPSCLRKGPVSGVVLDVGHRVTHGLEVLHLFVRDLHAELLLRGHHD